MDPATLEAIYRREAGRCTATLVRVLGDVDLAEDAVAEAFAIAAECWATSGVPPNPGGWLTTTARNRAIDHLRRESTRDERHLASVRLFEDDGAPTEPVGEAPGGPADVELVADDQLRLMFLCCHPALSPDAQVALTLRLLGGLRTPEIARAFLVPRADHGPAPGAGQAQNPRHLDQLPHPPARAAAAAPAARPGHHLSDLHRGPHRHRRPGADQAGPVGRGHPPGPPAGRPCCRTSRSRWGCWPCCC